MYLAYFATGGSSLAVYLFGHLDYMVFDASQWVQIPFTDRKTDEIKVPKKKHKTKAKA
ncbi:unnamed protein product [Brassica rapa subsp. trilocularis]